MTVFFSFYLSTPSRPEMIGIHNIYAAVGSAVMILMSYLITWASPSEANMM